MTSSRFCVEVKGVRRLCSCYCVEQAVAIGCAQHKVYFLGTTDIVGGGCLPVYLRVCQPIRLTLGIWHCTIHVYTSPPGFTIGMLVQY